MEATTIDTARSLWVIYQQMPTAVQDEFRRLLDHEEDDQTGWMQLTQEALQDDWEAPENDVWDEFYLKQNG